MAWGNLTDLVKTFAPIAHLDAQEVNFPASTGDYLPLVGYQVAGGQTYAPDKWTWAEVPKGPADNLVVPDPAPASIQSGNFSKATAYVHVQAVPGRANVVDIQYWLFYTFNGSETLRISTWVTSGEGLLPVSQHWADWECVTVRVNSDQEILAVWFSQHSGGQWCYPGDQYLSLSGKQPITYVSMGTHANRPVAGGPFTIGGLDFAGAFFGMVDYARGDGKTVNYANSFVIVANDATQYFPEQIPDPGWRTFQGFWGQQLGNTLTPAGLVAAVIAVLKSIPLLAPLIPLLGAGGALAAFGGSLLPLFTQDAPRNPSAQGPWNAQPLPPLAPPSVQFAPAMAVAPALGTLGIAYVDNDGINHLLASSLQNSWSAPAHANNMTSITAPALAATGSGVCMAFVSADAQIQAAITTDFQHWGNQNPVSKQATRATPTMAALGGKLWMLFQSHDSSNTIRYVHSGDGGLTWSDDNGIGQTSKAAPAMTVFGGKLWVAFVANDSSNRLLVHSSSNGTSWPGSNQTVGQPSLIAPALGVFGGKLCLVYVAADGSNQVMMATSQDGTHWTGFVPVGNLTAASAPAIATVPASGTQPETVYVACFPPGQTGQFTWCRSTDGVTWSQ